MKIPYGRSMSPFRHLDKNFLHFFLFPKGLSHIGGLSAKLEASPTASYLHIQEYVEPFELKKSQFKQKYGEIGGRKRKYADEGRGKKVLGSGMRRGAGVLGLGGDLW